MSKPLISAENQDDPLMEDIVEALYDVRHPFEIAFLGSNPFNIAGIIRTAHAFLARKIYHIETGWYYERGHMGAAKYEKYSSVKCTLENFEKMVERDNRNLICFERRLGMNSEDIRGLKYPELPIMIFGNEKDGVPDSLLRRATIVSIPMFGILNDINVSQAASIAMYDFVAKHYMKEPYGAAKV